MQAYALTFLLTVVGCLAGAALWRWLLLADKREGMSTERLCTILLVAGLSLRIIYAVLNPAFNSPDEQSHFNYVRYLVHEHAFPVLTTQTDSPANEWEYHQPPLYYLALTPFYFLGELLFGDGGAAAIVTRFGSILAWVLTAWFALKWLKRARIESAFAKVFVVGMVSLLPAYLTLSSSVNNDILLAALAAAVLYTISGELAMRRIVVAGLLCGLAMLTKGTAPIIMFAVAAVIASKAITREITYSRAFGYVFVVGTIAVIMWSPWGLRSYQLYSDPLGHGAAENPAEWKSIAHALRDTQEYIKESFWSAAGIYNRVRFLPSVGVHLLYVALFGLLYGCFGRSKALRAALVPEQYHFAWAMAASIAVNLLLTVAFGVRYAHGHGRFLFPMLLPISWFLALGLQSIGAKKIPNLVAHTAGFFLTYASGAVAYSLAEFVRIGA